MHNDQQSVGLCQQVTNIQHRAQKCATSIIYGYFEAKIVIHIQQTLHLSEVCMTKFLQKTFFSSLGKLAGRAIYFACVNFFFFFIFLL